MIPLLFIALVFGAGLAAYEFSPKTHTWVDEHVAAMQAAITAHRVADTHLQSAAAATSRGDIPQAEQQVAEADAANKVAAQHTGQAGATAQTPAQRQAAAKSHDQVIARGKQIGAAASNLAGGLIATAHAALSPFSGLGAGLCNARLYSGVTLKVRDALLARLHAAGMTVTPTGDAWAADTQNGPWDIDPQRGGVKLRAVLDGRAQQLKLIVTAPPTANLFCNMIWAQIDPIMKEVLSA